LPPAYGGDSYDISYDIRNCSRLNSLVVDLRADEAPRLALEAVFGACDILVNNAGVGGSRSVGKLPAERWNEVIDVNLSSVFRLCKHIVPTWQPVALDG
jgi:NAD(P)-dependent dehydrogenase (short-subunit alcohol dehydrogenase family)